MTNFERLKKMDVVSFASATAMGFPCDLCKYDGREEGKTCPTNVTCKAAYREWLEEEAEELTNDR